MSARRDSAGPSASTARIVVNGKEYDSPDHMPAEVRRLYDLAAGAALSDPLIPGSASSPLTLAGKMPRRSGLPTLVALVAGAILLALLWYFLGGPGRRS